MRLVRSAIVTLIACLTWSGQPAIAQKFIEGQIEHLEFVDPLDGFTVGATFDEKLLPSGEDSMGNWWPVPQWLAGSWHKTGKIEVLSFTDLKKDEPIKSKRKIRVYYPDNEVLGHQKDDHGQVWTYVPVPCVMKTYAADVTNVNIINSFDLVDDSKEDSLTLRLFLVTIMVDKENKVTSICQRECLQTWTTVDRDTVCIFESTRFFNREGEPIASKRTRTYTEKCGEYCPVNFISRSTLRPLQHQNYSTPKELRNSPSLPLDLRDSLADFLRTHKVTSRVPDSTP